MILVLPYEDNFKGMFITHPHKVIQRSSTIFPSHSGYINNVFVLTSEGVDVTVKRHISCKLYETS